MRGQQHVYAIETDDGHIKVGVTFDVKKRLGSLQVGNHRPLTLVFDSQVLDVSVDPLAREFHGDRGCGRSICIRSSEALW